MNCESCGKPVKKGEKYCPNCGSPIRQSEEGASGGGSTRETGILIAVLCILMVAITALVVIFFIAPGMRSDKEPSNDNKAAAEASESEQTEAPQTQAPQTQAPQTEPVQTETVPQTTEAVTETQPPTPDNGIHYYEFYTEDVSWTTAQSRCREKRGKLLTIDTEEEYTYIKDQIRSKGYDKTIFYLGGMRTPGSHEYYWLNADGSTYGASLNGSGNWMKGEPSYEDSTVNVSEEYMDFFYYSSESRWVWNDIPNDLIGIVPSYAGKIGYICEFEE